jgi:hypothetical protein
MELQAGINSIRQGFAVEKANQRLLHLLDKAATAGLNF